MIDDKTGITKKYDIRYIPWTLKQTGLDQDGTRICNTMVSVYEKLKPENKKLRIICVDVLEPDGLMSEITATEVLQYFLKNILNFESQPGTCIDVICMPSIKIDSPHPGRMVELIWELRQKVVIISGIKVGEVHLKSPGTDSGVNIVGTEALTVGADIELSPGTRPDLLGTDVKVRPDDNSN